MIRILISELKQQDENFAKINGLTEKNKEIRAHIAELISQTNLRGSLISKLDPTPDFDPEVDEFEIIGYELSEDAKQARFKVSLANEFGYVSTNLFVLLS